MSIMVCDAIMGSGKSSAVIQHINENPHRRFIYISPYLNEATRIAEACPDLRFVEPSERLPEFGFSKYNHTHKLLSEGRNIACSHQMFRHFKPELIELIRAGKYTLIVDEAVDVFEQLKLKRSDLEIVNLMGWVDKEGQSAVGEQTPLYQGERFKDVFELAKNGNFAILSHEGDIYYWVMSTGFFEAFEDVYILTYLFDCQTLKYYFDMNGIEYRKIGIEHPSDEVYRFTDGAGYIPDYVGTLSRKIHVLTDSRLNQIGERNTALSSNWFERRRTGNNKDMETLRRNVQNYFRNICSDKEAGLRMWSTFKDYIGCLRGKGFYNSSLSFNSKATNEYKHKRVLAYCVNIFMKPEEKRYFLAKGVDVKEDEAALSVLVQWVWRSAIREGKEIWLYVPSRRMRSLFIRWMQNEERRYNEYMDLVKTA